MVKGRSQFEQDHSGLDIDSIFSTYHIWHSQSPSRKDNGIWGCSYRQHEGKGRTYSCRNHQVEWMNLNTLSLKGKKQRSYYSFNTESPYTFESRRNHCVIYSHFGYICHFISVTLLLCCDNISEAIIRSIPNLLTHLEIRRNHCVYLYILVRYWKNISISRFYKRF